LSATLFLLFFRIVVTIATNSLPSRTSADASVADPIRHRLQTRSRIHDSGASLSPMEHFKMKSASLSAARAAFKRGMLLHAHKFEHGECQATEVILLGFPPAESTRTQIPRTHSKFLLPNS